MSLTSPQTVAPDELPADARVRPLRRVALLTALVGAAHAVLFLVSFALMSRVPGANASTQEIVDFYASGRQRRVVIVGLYVMPFAGIAFIWFAVALRMWVEGAGRRANALLSNVQFVAAILYVALLFVSAASSSVMATSVEFSDGDVDPVVAHQFPVFGSALTLVFALRMAAMFVITTSTIGRRAGVMPRAFTYAGYVVGAFLLLTATLEPWFALVFPVWLIALSVILARKAIGIDPELLIVRQERTPSVVVIREHAAANEPP